MKLNLGVSVLGVALFLGAIANGQTEPTCIEKLTHSLVRHAPSVKEQSCVQEKSVVALATLCPNGEILPKFAIYLDYESKKQEALAVSWDRWVAFVQTWKADGYYEDLEINSALNKIPDEAYACRNAE